MALSFHLLILKKRISNMFLMNLVWQNMYFVAEICLTVIVVLCYEDLTGSGVCSTGNEGPTNRSLISELIRPLQISGDKPELLSVKPTFLSRSRASSPARAFLSEVPVSVHSDPLWVLIECFSVPFPVCSLQCKNSLDT